MRCPFCGHLEDKVVDSRESREGDAIRRRRECLKCTRRFTSYERVEETPVIVLKKDGRREPFDAQKLMKGLMLACQKRPVSLSKMEELVSDIQARLMERADREIPARQLGEMVMDELKALDQVAYVRFASVYRDFKDLPDFVRALEEVLIHRDREQDPARSQDTPKRVASATPSIEQPLFPNDDEPRSGRKK
jgi:transcriptional repressor NrdR